MLSRFFVQFLILMLFAVGQTGVATHALEHIPHHASESHSEHEDDEHSEELCLQCVAKSQAEQSDLQRGFSLAFVGKQGDIVTFEFSSFASPFIEPYSARAPPAFS